MNLPDRQQKASNPLHGTYPVCHQFPWRGTRQNKNRRPMTQLIGSAHLSAGGSILVSDVGHFGKITICPTKIAISSTIRSITLRFSKKSGQSLSPCVEVNGHMLADVNRDEVEAYLLEAGVLHLTAAVADAPATERGG